MKLKKQPSLEEGEANNRFLIKHSSSSLLNMFGCCSSSSAQDYQSLNVQKPQPHKISIKSVLKKSAIFGMNGSPSVSESRYCQANQKGQGVSPSSFNRVRNSHLTDVSSSLIKNQSERTIPKKDNQKINFIYNKQESDKTVHNYHTTNYIVQKYIVKPQQMNIFLKNPQLQHPQGYPQKNKQPSNVYQYNEYGELGQQRNMQKEELNNCHFSFGAAQKKLFVNKFTGFREVSSNRPSKEAPKIQSQMEQQNKQQADELPTFLSLGKKQNLNNLVRDVSVMDEEFDDENSQASQVIDSYQNIMSRIQQKGYSGRRFENYMK